MNLRPFFYYYGGKFRMAPKYPAPLFDKISEPFAGSAGYATRYPKAAVRLYEIHPQVYGVWKYLIAVPSQEVRRLPAKLQHVDELPSWVPQEAKWLIGFYLNKACVSPRQQMTAYAPNRPNSYWGETVRERLSQQVRHIRHWKVYRKSYEQALNRRATWFIDPPYDSPSGRLYPFHDIDYSELANYCRRRKGQVIVCEGPDAKWLPFRPLGKVRPGPNSESRRGMFSEYVWEGR